MLSVEEIRADRPVEVLRARWLSFVCVVLWLSVGGYLYPTLPGPGTSESPGLLLLAIWLCVWGAFGVAKGRKAARTMSTVAFALFYFSLLPACWIGFADPQVGASAIAITDIATTAVSVYVLVLMYHPASNRYIHLITIARAGPR